MGGAVAAIESGWMAEAIGESAYRAQQAIERGEASVVGVNAFVEASTAPQIPISTSIPHPGAATPDRRLRAFARPRSALEAA